MLSFKKDINLNVIKSYFIIVNIMFKFENIHKNNIENIMLMFERYVIIVSLESILK